MNKKILVSIVGIITLVVISIIAITLIGKNKEKNINEVDISTNTNKTDNISKDFGIWKIENKEMPKIAPLTWEEVKVSDTNSRNIATTPFELEIDEVYEKLKSNNYIKENYNNLTKSHTEKVENIIGGKVPFYYLVSLISAEHNQIGNAQIRFQQDAFNYNNINAIQIKFDKITLSNSTQDEMYSIVEDTVGELAEYLVYAEDKEDLGLNSNEMPEYWEKFSMSEIIQNEKSSYYLERIVTKESAATDIYSITFSVGVKENFNDNDGNYEGNNFNTEYKNIQYNFEDLLPESFGNRNPLTPSLFGDKIFENNNEKSRFDDWNMWISEYENNKKSYWLRMAFESVQNRENKSLKSPKLEYGVKYTEENGKITKTKCGIIMTIYKDKGISNKEMFDKAIFYIKNLLPEVDLSNLVYNENETSYEEEIRFNILGIENKEKLKITISDTGVRIYMNMSDAIDVVV